MRNCIVYFLTCLFLLFVVESKLNIKTLQNDFSGKISHSLPQKTSTQNQTSNKISVQQSSDRGADLSFELAEDDFQLSDTFQEIAVYACIFTLVYIFGLKSFKKLKPTIHGFLSEFSTVKRFILIRSIRI